MPKARFIQYDGDWWRLSDLAQSHGLNRATLRYRLDVAKLPIDRALATGIKSPTEAGRISASVSRWHRRF